MDTNKEIKRVYELPPNYTFTPLKHGLEIRSSEIHGVGIFASLLLPEETNLGPSHYKLECTESIYTPSDMAMFEKYHPDMMVRTCLGGFVNHSLTPNVELIDEGCYYSFKTIKDIDCNEELTVDYFKSACGGDSNCNS